MSLDLWKYIAIGFFLGAGVGVIGTALVADVVLTCPAK